MRSPECNECYYSHWLIEEDIGVLCCKHPDRLYRNCSYERGVFLAPCGQLGRHWQPKDYVQKKEFCANCSEVWSLVFDFEKQIPEGLTVGDVREKYACLGGECPDLKTFGIHGTGWQKNG